jgi:hypothetical protein
MKSSLLPTSFATNVSLSRNFQPSQGFRPNVTNSQKNTSCRFGSALVAQLPIDIGFISCILGFGSLYEMGRSFFLNVLFPAQEPRYTTPQVQEIVKRVEEAYQEQLSTLQSAKTQSPPSKKT